MRIQKGKAFRAYLAAATMLAGGAVFLPSQAAAQVTTGSVRGQVVAADGTPAAGATIAARNTGTGQTQRAVASIDGRYALTGLRPGSYEVTAEMGGATVTNVVTLAIGQSATLNLTLGATGAAAPADVTGDEIVVIGTDLVETRTSEVATNVSREQIESLPQTDRNFLSFTQLAPGVVYNDSETNKGFSSGASTRSQVNVFIDGVSLKNQVLDGGIAGQQDSRGNPFGQLAVQEFRVLTQNYKAEYEQAGAAIVTAITRSGSNEFHGEVFGQYTDKGLAQKSYLDNRFDRPEPAFERKQYGISLGGPIIEDRLFFFGAYEGNDQDRAFNVQLGNRSPENLARFGQYEGNFVSPFRGDFYFGKLTLVPDDNQVFDLSFSRREESDIQGFGGQNAYSVAENKINRNDTYSFRWTYNDASGLLNEFNASYLNYTYNPTSLNPDLPSYEYRGVITFGGKDSTQEISQQSYTLRNDTTYSGLADHVFKAGVRLAWQDYDFNKRFFVQPRYTFINDGRGTADPADDLTFDFPSEARLGLGNPRIAASNFQLGAYIQDDWTIGDHLELNLGLRWDYESNMFNNNYVTPTNAALALRALPGTAYFDPENYITDGHDRKPFLGMFQPRAGFSYDIGGDQRSVIFGGYGRYYDRNVFNNTLDERFRTQYQTGTFYFSQDGAPRNGNPTVIWDPAYGTREGLLALQATAQTGLPELFAVPNDARPPVNDQFSLGFRQEIGSGWRGSITASYQIGRDGYTHLFATRNPDGTCCDTAPARAYGYANVLIGYSGLDTRYKALFFTLDHDYTEASGYGVNISYTLSKGEQNGNDLFSLDKPTPDQYGWRPRPGDERHRVVISGMVDLPLGFRFSTVTTLGSGRAYQITDQTEGTTIDLTRITSAYPEKHCIEGIFAFCEVNLTLEKRFEVVGGDDLGIAVDLLNAFNNKNFEGFDGYVSASDPLDPANIGNNLLTLPRRIQFRAFYRF